MSELSLENGEGGRWWSWRTAVWCPGVMVLVGVLVAKQFVGEGGWIDLLAQTGALLIGVGVAIELAARKTGRAAYRTALGLATVAVIFLGWANAAVGIIGSADDPANRMYGGVFVVGVIGAIIARLQARRMVHVLTAMAMTQALIAVIALLERWGTPSSDPLEIVCGNGFFIALFAASAVLFGKAAGDRLETVAC